MTYTYTPKFREQKKTKNTSKAKSVKPRIGLCYECYE